jgi:hypothetical protein
MQQLTKIILLKAEFKIFKITLQLFFFFFFFFSITQTRTCFLGEQKFQFHLYQFDNHSISHILLPFNIEWSTGN